SRQIKRSKGFRWRAASHRAAALRVRVARHYRRWPGGFRSLRDCGGSLSPDYAAHVAAVNTNQGALNQRLSIMVWLSSAPPLHAAESATSAVERFRIRRHHRRGVCDFRQGSAFATKGEPALDVLAFRAFPGMPLESRYGN